MKGAVYSANEGNVCKWVPGVRRFIDYLKEADKPTARPYTLRYSGCLVADVHRLLTGGGIYLYPAETNKPEGKLRLLYEANPLAMVVEQAGGRASTGAERILGYQAEEVIGKNFSIFYGPDDLQNRKPQGELREATEKGRVEDEGWRIRKDRTRFWADRYHATAS